MVGVSREAGDAPAHWRCHAESVFWKLVPAKDISLGVNYPQEGGKKVFLKHPAESPGKCRVLFMFPQSWEVGQIWGSGVRRPWFESPAQRVF